MTTTSDAASVNAEMSMVVSPTGVDPCKFMQYADGMPDPVFFKDLEHRWVAFNRAFCALLGRPAAELVGKSDPDFFPPDQVAVFWDHDHMVFSSGKPDLNEERVTAADGGVRVIWTRKTPVYGDSGAIVGLVGIIMDITDQQAHKRAMEVLEAEASQQAALITAQREIIDSLVVPVLEVWDGILLLPLVGALSHSRASNAIEGVLAAVSQRRAETVLIDVTGVGNLDAEVVDLLIRAIRAIGLLGCRSILVGISAAAARALIESGMDLSAVTTCATLKQGLAAALRRRTRGVAP
jgi:rsbT co-antagonist protein RsbR